MGIRDAVALLGIMVPVRYVRSARRVPFRPQLLRLANAGLARHPRDYTSSTLSNGLRFSGRTADVVQRHIHVFGSWEPPLTGWIESRLRPGDVFLDFGANVGYFSLIAARSVGPRGRVVAFECVPSILALLERNIADNAFANVLVRPVIAGDRSGRGEVFAGPVDNAGMAGTTLTHGGRSEGNVRRMVAADAVPPELWSRVRLIKIDVEGDEMQVLRGLAPLLAQLPSDAALAVEVSPERLRSRGQSAVELIRFLARYGFSAAALPNEYTAEFYLKPHSSKPIPVMRVPEEQTDMVFSR